MDTLIIAALSSFAGGLISYFLQHRKYSYDLKLKQEELKTEFVAERTVRHFLNHKSYTDRSFDTLKSYIGGFEEDELRKILVRAGAIRIYREDGSEWWRLLSRMEEYIEKKKES